MRILVLIVIGLTAWAVIQGLWNHDWHLIVAGVACSAVYPFIGRELEV